MGYIKVMLTVAETPTFTKQADDLFDEDEKQALISFLAQNPLAGDVISGTGGVRKVRYAASGRGKRGGARVIYYYFDESLPLYALLVYPKNAKTDLTPDDKRATSAFVEALKATRRKI
jgi:mRNA-degrading endonuclease RelE of RelBE toxin-antitoxin system